MDKNEKGTDLVHDLVEMRKDYESTQMARKVLLEELKKNSNYKELEALEKKNEEMYQQARDRFVEFVKAENIEDRVEGDNGYVSVSKTRKLNIVDETKLESYFDKNKIDKSPFVKMAWKQTELKKFVFEQDGLGEEVDGVVIEPDISIAVNIAKEGEENES